MAFLPFIVLMFIKYGKIRGVEKFIHSKNYADQFTMRGEPILILMLVLSALISLISLWVMKYIGTNDTVTVDKHIIIPIILLFTSYLHVAIFYKNDED